MDLIIINARVDGHSHSVDIGIAGGRIVDIAPSIAGRGGAAVYDAEGAFAFAGFVETHIHLDKALILDRCPICTGTLKEAVSLTAAAKAAFTVDDVKARAAQVIRQAIFHGTMRLRTFVEVDPRAGFRSLEAIQQIKAEFGWAIDIEICAFAQEGVIKEPETLGMLAEALKRGADLVGGCPYTDTDPVAHVTAIFDLAEAAGVAVDFHADFDLDPEGSILPAIIKQTRGRGYSGRVSVGHVTKLAAMSPGAADTFGRQLAEAGVAVTVLPATDLFLAPRLDNQTPRGLAPAARLAELGVITSLATNNVMNPFTPLGDASLGRIANLYANIAQLGTDAAIRGAYEMVTTRAAQLLGAPYGLAVGGDADIVLLDAPDAVSAVRQVAPALAGWKRGQPTFRRPRAILLPPSGAISPPRS